MKIAVCIKQVVTREWQLRVNDAGTWIRDQDASFELNEPDAYALEEALRLKEKHGGEVVVCCAGPAARVAGDPRGARARRRPRHPRRGRDVPGTRRRGRGGGRAGRGDAATSSSTSSSPASSPTIRASARSASSWPRSSACRTPRSSWKCRRPTAALPREARARGRLVPVARPADAGAAHHPERHQPAALRDAQGHHGGEEEGDPQGRAAGRRRRARSGSFASTFPEKGKKTQMIAGSAAEAAKDAGQQRLRDDARVI